MRTSLVGTTSRNRAGVTLLELLIVVTLIALVAGVGYPSMSAGLATLRLRAASNAVVTFLSTALDRADRRQQAIEIVISPADNTLLARSSDLRFNERLQVPEPVHIVGILPSVMSETSPEPRRFLIYPGGSAPRIAIELANANGGRRRISVDPLSGFARVEAPAQ
jgi:prepilin-type N-terminal cleavage/methylation domain-containing protein